MPVRYRLDGWTPRKQSDYIAALSECGCVVEACRRVGMSTESVYRLAHRPDAQSFRVAREIALDNGVRRIADGAFSRAIHGVSVPHYYKGELVGEHRRYDERLVMFVLRHRDPYRFGRAGERDVVPPLPEQRALDLGAARFWAEGDAIEELTGRPRTVVSPVPKNEDEWLNALDVAQRAGKARRHNRQA